ncbi:MULTISPECIES: ABC transporter ATP-binding protein [Psychrilyobacter]|uniref:ATP-binding cassette domain-containing protein n=1 Tax=Psychrilyobacter piezotolerans TaxID=2293438 RepID=A0ABX9KJQ5_9FUSO|nr:MULTISPECIES: ABC transporter ATP-binding protein [Psychrilyobacter]MCS5420852.1 ABC transporter ATP-binding protein [Psychrilyobacter sp. S5]NDI76828.1 ABC transporter ATP-binding protein [Psychrilyobacter piezotolerans]RDE65108.1 ABC transporter ATP-binding protein [Psychrilyobacter sp. S5]REI42678.1 ATP-binding cassette domain-containing protein [Psychrilyobacter piezotolerans]
MSDIILKIEKLNKHYKDKKRDIHILNDLDFEINKGEFVSVLGKSGSGKTTFLNMIGMLDRPDSGDVYYAGQNVSKAHSSKIDLLRNEMLGFIFQFHYLLPEFSALENVMLPGLIGKKKNREEVKKRAAELLVEMQLGDRLDHKPTELSGGEKQRVAIARAMINEPKIILADEPTGNLDEETSEVIHNLLRKICREKNQTIIVVTHSTELANITDKRYHLTKGKLELVTD